MVVIAMLPTDAEVRLMWAIRPPQLKRTAVSPRARFCEDTQRGRARPEPMHFSSCNSAFFHDNIISPPPQRWLSDGGLTLIAPPTCRVWLDRSKYIARRGNARSGEGNFGGGGLALPAFCKCALLTRDVKQTTNKQRCGARFHFARAL
jgi:hypothetical protein